MLTAPQLQKKLGITKRRLERWRKEGLPSRMKNRKRMFDPVVVAAWIEQNGKGRRETAGLPVFEKGAGECGSRTVATTRNEAAQALGVSLRTLAEWLNDPSFPGKPGSPGRQDGYFPLAEITAWRQTKFGGDGRSKGGDAGQLAEKRARRLDLQNDLLQVEVEKSLGSILDAEEMAGFLERHVGVAKTILEQLADKVDTRLPAKLDTKTRAVIRAAVDETVTEAFNAVAETMRENAAADDADTSKKGK